MRVESMQSPPAPVSGADLPSGPCQVRKTFVRILDEIDKGERLMEEAVRRGLRGKDFSPQELIALQAGVYEYTHRLEVFSKLVDRAASAVRQVMNP
jgi:hypothetical protein